MQHPMSFIIALTFFICNTANGQIITKIAGNDTAGYSGDGGPATAAMLNGPRSAHPDKAGNIYIADVENNRIRKVNASGIITSIAGNGSMVHGGDGGPATAAGIIFPQSVVVDSSGNIYIAEADQCNGGGCIGGWIRKINTAGIITTIAGNIRGFSGDGGPATAAQLSYVSDITIDGTGNIYIVDRGNGRIRKITTDGIIHTIAGNGTYGFSGDGGQATDAQLGNPVGIAVDDSGNVYISSDQSYNNVRKVNNAGIITTIAGIGGAGFSGDGGAATAAALNFPESIAVDHAGYLYIGDAYNGRLRRVAPDGIITTIAGTDMGPISGGDGGPAIDANIFPFSVAIDSSGNIYISDPAINTGNNNVRKICTHCSGLHVPIYPKEEVPLHIFPNPASNECNITVSEGITLSKAEIYDVTGRLIQSFKLSGSNETIDISRLKPGIYNCIISNAAHSSFAKKLVIIK